MVKNSFTSFSTVYLSRRDTSCANRSQCRVMGGYHIQADNIEGLTLGRKVSEFSWPRIQRISMAPRR